MEYKHLHKKITGAAALPIILSMILSACAGSVPTNVPADEEEQLIETLQAISSAVAPTLTSAPTLTPFVPTAELATSAPPTTIPTHTPSFSLPGAARITFAPGATYGSARGSIGPNQTENYVLQAGQGQPLLVTVSSQDNDVTMSITTASGTALLPASQARSSWQGTLPSTQNYYIQIIGGNSEENYALSVSIPSRIEFAAGAVSATVSGQTVNGNITSYVVAAQAGQTMDVVLTPEPNAAALTVWGFSDGQPYLRSQAGSTTFNMQLPSTQDYIIDVVPQAGQEVNFTLMVEIR